MTSAAARLAVVTALAASAAGCGLGPGASSSGTVTLTVTRDYGSKTLVSASQDDPPSSETVIRFLDDEAEISTRYGGGFVQSINGLAGTGSSDWFFYVNGTESPVGSAEVHVKGGDRIWWDYRNWSGAMSVPAVVGAWPEPFAQAASDRPQPAVVECADVHSACEIAQSRLAAAGARATITEGTAGNAAPRLLVGTWTQVRRDPAVDAFRGGPASNGVFATFTGSVREDRWRLIGLDPSGTPARDFGARAGLVAALGRGGAPRTWIVTGSGAGAVRRAAKDLSGRRLRNHYAIAALPGKAAPLPVLRRGSS